MIDFPNAPTTNQIYTAAGASWMWDGTKWTAASGGSTAYAPLASPVFTGDARAVTPATADNDTSIATTAYVQAQGYATSAAMTTADNLRVLKAGDTMTGALSINTTVNDPLTLTVGAGLASRTRYTVSAMRTWTAGCMNDGTFAISDESAAMTRLRIGTGGDLNMFGGFIESNGNAARSGINGTVRGNHFNIDWATGAQLWIDNVNQGTFTLTCDYRIKDNVAALSSTWDKVRAIRPISYNFKACPELLRDVGDPEQRWGFLAHELQEAVLPTAASGYKDAPNVVQSPDIMALLAAVTRALQEAMARIEVLEAGAPIAQRRRQ